MKPLSEKELREKIDEALVPVFKYLCEGKTPFYPESLSEFMVGDEAGKKIIDLILSDRKAWGEQVSKPLLRMLDLTGVEKCPVCTEHMIDEDLNICESCNYGVHEWCTGYTYSGDGEYPAESAYAICKPCFSQRNQGEKTDEDS